MKIDYRRLTENELDTFINMRINQLKRRDRPGASA